MKKRSRDDMEPSPAELTTPRPAPAMRKSVGAPPSATPRKTQVRYLKVVDAAFNVSGIVEEEAAKMGLHELSQSSPEVLKGLKGHGKLLEAYGVFQVSDLGCWQPYVFARALLALEAAEDSTKPNPNLNIHRAVHGAFEDKSAVELLALPVSSLVCVGARVDEDMQELGITCLRDLASWPCAAYASAISDLACYEHTRVVVSK